MQDILELIQNRQSERVLFDSSRPIARKDLKQILEAGRWSPTAHNMQNYEIIAVEDKKILEAIGKIKYPISNTFIRENYQQLSFSEEELLKKKVGLLGTMFPPFMRNPDVKPDRNNDDKMNTFLEDFIRTSPVVLIVLYDPAKKTPASEGDFLGIMSLGCVMENMWLMANSLGISFHIMSALSAEQVEKQVKSILKIPEHLIIAFSVRIGYPVSLRVKYLRVRREVEDFTHYNQFGNKNL